MDVPTLILLGAVGGVLRGVVDLYIQFANWRSARGAHQREQLSEHVRPRLTQYFDPAVDLAAAGVHSVMGAGMAVLFGTTGQISGPYAAIVVGASAPVLLTQLARIQSVSEALGGGQAGAGPAAPSAGVGAGPAEPAVTMEAAPVDPAVTMGTGPVDPTVTMGAGPVDPAQQAVPSRVQPALPEQGAAVLDDPQAATASGAAALQPNAEAGPSQRTSSQLRSAAFRQDAETAQPHPNGQPTDPGHGHGGRGTPPLRRERAAGEEGRP
ncbi:hypothetical protein [Streptomyces sp. NBC_00299]|uniref:hypothetical protein n=1 Tax=Streptomyces sp. NBC_00299 TaxID=2975705 RepID=UPI002E2B78D0|nr:hypothetical protein [Streptomyces sp. NBC_00299]